MSTNSVCFCGEIRKILGGYPLLSGTMGNIRVLVRSAIQLFTKL